MYNTVLDFSERPARRTQAQRSAETRALLLNATIVCLIEHGYAGMSTRLVADRAGLSQGALQGQFKTKAQLVSSAVRYLEEQLLGELATISAVPADPDPQTNAAEFLDRLWSVYNGPLFVAGLELIVAARTDAALKDAVDELTVSIMEHHIAGARALIPDAAGHPSFFAWMMQATTTVHGLALRRLMPRLTVDDNWPALRSTLLDSLRTLLDAD
jgi:AcrR family transcriptional regulator